nr:type I-B CRISPR-associated protein Cas7/Cst2/DevR [Nocardiopsis mwathae]
MVGKIALDITAGAPNNGRGEDNVARVKSLLVGRERFPYVSAQAFRRWLRDSLPATEERSKVTRSGTGKKQQAYTDGRPDKYLDDDLFGYMVAVKKESYQRDTVLATGTFVSLASKRITQDFGTMSRGFSSGEDPVIHEHEHYTAELAADVLFDLPRVGTFEQNGGGLRRALGEKAAAEAKTSAGAVATTLRGVECLRLPIEERRRRTGVLLRTFAQMQGGANRALHYGDRSPALVLLAPLKGGNNPFTRVLTMGDKSARFDLTTFIEEKRAWHEELDGPITIGWAPGFLGDQRESVRRELAEDIAAGEVVIDHPRVVLQALAKQIEAGQLDSWFEDESA